MNKIYLSFFVLILLVTSSCSQDTGVFALAESEPIETSGDAADDPALIINFKNPRSSLFFGTDKTAGVYLYDLKGVRQSFSPLGAINNIDAISSLGSLVPGNICRRSVSCESATSGSSADSGEITA